MTCSSAPASYQQHLRVMGNTATQRLRLDLWCESTYPPWCEDLVDSLAPHLVATADHTLAGLGYRREDELIR